MNEWVKGHEGYELTSTIDEETVLQKSLPLMPFPQG